MATLAALTEGPAYGDRKGWLVIQARLLPVTWFICQQNGHTYWMISHVFTMLTLWEEKWTLLALSGLVHSAQHHCSGLLAQVPL